MIAPNFDEYVPWIEKYRPKLISDVIDQNHVTKFLKLEVNSKKMSNLIFYGSPGTGKTSAILAAAKELYTEKEYKNNILELNGSNERGINNIKTIVKQFANKSNNGLFKLIILDEADSMTLDAQYILYSIIDKYSHLTKFCIICNYIHNILPKLSSICIKFKFNNLKKNSIVDILKNICKNEKINCCDKNINYIYKLSNGDLRTSINVLQICSLDKQITINNINYINGLCNNIIITNYINVLKNKDSKKIDKYCDFLLRDGYINICFIKQIFSYFINKKNYKNINQILQIIINSYNNLIKMSHFYIELFFISYQISNKL